MKTLKHILMATVISMVLITGASTANAGIIVNDAVETNQPCVDTNSRNDWDISISELIGIIINDFGGIIVNDGLDTPTTNCGIIVND